MQQHYNGFSMNEIILSARPVVEFIPSIMLRVMVCGAGCQLGCGFGVSAVQMMHRSRVSPAIPSKIAHALKMTIGGPFAVTFPVLMSYRNEGAPTNTKPVE
mmetsp:Transcript_94047/g.166562  ORF Transcript_94047/g.166562 Transcript_94047/m.166562 type:complete len:101 (-) Transcript_94047:960-1262(-)